MKGLIGRIFGAPDVIKGGFDLIDSMHTSKEEEIVATTQAKVDLLQSYSAFKLAQRVLAIMFATTFLACFALVMGKVLAGSVSNLNDVRAVISEFWIGEIMLTIVAFYFGGGAFEGAFKARKK